MKKKVNAICSWSGGKDSCLACYKAIQSGLKISGLLNFITREYKRCCFHGLDSELLKLQAEAVGITIAQREVSPDMQAYEKEFKDAVSSVRSKDTSSMIFGDIYLDEHKSWVDRVCSDIDIIPVEPLWGLKPRTIIEEFIGLGFKALVVSCKADILGREFVGRYIDMPMVSELESRGICPCGENGEFHTVVVDGPMFKKKIEIDESEPVLKEGFWKYWFLDIKKYRLSL